MIATLVSTGTWLTAPAVVGAQTAPTPQEVCVDGRGIVCEQVYEWTGNASASRWIGWMLNKPITILLIALVAWILTRIIHRSIEKGMERVRTTALDADGSSNIPISLDDTTRQRVEQRTTTLGTVLNSLAKLIVWIIAILVILGELGVSLAPLIAGAGIAGVALGFGAQTIVRDFLSGIFILVEDQYGVGDIVDLGEATGTVERVTLRTTVLRDVYGTVWHVPNGEILRVGNKSQLWSNALIDVGVAYGADVDRASTVIADAAHELHQDPEWSATILDEPKVLGIQDLAADAVTIRLSVRVEPAAQFAIERELRRRIKIALDAAQIDIPFPQRTVWVRREQAGDQDG